MITLHSGDFPEFEDSVFSLRQKAYFNAYGASTPFFMLWSQKKSGETVAVISSLSGDVTLSLSENSDFDEIESFLYAIGFSSVFYNAEYEGLLRFANAEKGKIMRLEKTVSAEKPDFSKPDYKAVFDLLFEKGEASFGDWFTDLAHKNRHGSADIVTKTVNGKTVAVAVCIAKTDKAALIGSVKTDREYRNNGYGTKLVAELCSYLQESGRQIFLCREENKNREFYLRLGFADCGEWITAKNE